MEGWIESNIIYLRLCIAFPKIAFYSRGRWIWAVKALQWYYKCAQWLRTNLVIWNIERWFLFLIYPIIRSPLEGVIFIFSLMHFARPLCSRFYCAIWDSIVITITRFIFNVIINMFVNSFESSFLLRKPKCCMINILLHDIACLNVRKENEINFMHHWNWRKRLTYYDSEMITFETKSEREMFEWNQISIWCLHNLFDTQT